MSPITLDVPSLEGWLEMTSALLAYDSNDPAGLGSQQPNIPRAFYDLMNAYRSAACEYNTFHAKV